MATFGPYIAVVHPDYHLKENDQYKNAHELNHDYVELEVQFNGDSISGIDGPRLEEDCQTEVSKNKELQVKLKKLSQYLALNQVEKEITNNDLLHQENVKMGRNKYKTRKEIRQCSIASRLEYFENM